MGVKKCKSNFGPLWAFFLCVCFCCCCFTVHVLVQILFCIWFSGRGYDVMLNNILMAEIMPIVEEFDEQTNNGNRLIHLNIPSKVITVCLSPDL